MIIFKQKGDLKKTTKFLTNAANINYLRILEKYGREGVQALSLATPVDSGTTASSWYYEIDYRRGGYVINWNNSNVVNGVSIAVIIQFGHGTKNGSYVAGRDYINPALKPIFDKIATEAWREVSKL